MIKRAKRSPSIRREYNDVKGRVELQRHVVKQLHMVEAEAGEAEAALNALLVLGLLAKVARPSGYGPFEPPAANCSPGYRRSYFVHNFVIKE